MSERPTVAFNLSGLRLLFLIVAIVLALFAALGGPIPNAFAWSWVAFLAAMLTG